jgi:hypothetical protein
MRPHGPPGHCHHAIEAHHHPAARGTRRTPRLTTTTTRRATVHIDSRPQRHSSHRCRTPSRSEVPGSAHRPGPR